jgi:hypothetical protein
MTTVRWEYHVIQFYEGEALDGLNRLGRDGWQLCAVIGPDFILKRPVSAVPDTETMKMRTTRADGQCLSRHLSASAPLRPADVWCGRADVSKRPHRNACKRRCFATGGECFNFSDVGPGAVVRYNFAELE